MTMNSMWAVDNRLKYPRALLLINICFMYLFIISNKKKCHLLIKKTLNTGKN